jgi:transposase InsO family protein
VQNAFIESFNSKLRDECLNEYVFTSLGEARAIIEARRHDYNHPAPALESRVSDAGGVRCKESRELGHRAHLLASRAGRRGATRADLGSKTRQFFSRPQRVKGGRKNWDEHETKTTNDAPQEGSISSIPASS